MEIEQTKRSHTTLFRVRCWLFNVLLTFSLLLATVLLRQAARAAELRGVMDQGFLNLIWDAPDAKLEEAPNPAGPRQTVIATGSPYRLRPAASLTNGGRFYRLKMPSPGKKWLTVAAVTMQSRTNTEANRQTLFSYMERAPSNRVDLIVFPEVALQGYPGWREDSAKPSVQEMAYIRQTAKRSRGRAPATWWPRRRS